MQLYEHNSIKIYNTLTGKKETFKSIEPGYVGMYVCGPTVYSNVHLGNVRTFMSFDMVFRYLKHLGYKVRYVRNITDAGHLENDADAGEDKITKKARLEQIEPMTMKTTGMRQDLTLMMTENSATPLLVIFMTTQMVNDLIKLNLLITKLMHKPTPKLETVMGSKTNKPF